MVFFEIFWYLNVTPEKLRNYAFFSEIPLFFSEKIKKLLWQKKKTQLFQLFSSNAGYSTVFPGASIDMCLSLNYKQIQLKIHPTFRNLV